MIYFFFRLLKSVILIVYDGLKIFEMVIIGGSMKWARPGEQLEAVPGMVRLGAGGGVFERRPWRRWGGWGSGKGKLCTTATTPPATYWAAASQRWVELVGSEKVRVFLSQHRPYPHPCHQHACTALNCNITAIVSVYSERKDRIYFKDKAKITPKAILLIKSGVWVIKLRCC